MLPYYIHLKEPSRSLRTHMTNAERKLWSRIRNKQILDIQFYRQKPLLGFIVDFYAPKAKIVIEVDGSQHLKKSNKIQDQERDLLLQQLELTVIRFDNFQVLKETDSVVEQITEIIRKNLKIPLNPPLLKGEVASIPQRNLPIC